ncbi:MAG: histidine kinase [Chloroflexi bacterium]|nr:histidine kinase [Chloroflexota bacterium]
MVDHHSGEVPHSSQGLRGLIEKIRKQLIVRRTHILVIVGFLFIILELVQHYPDISSLDTGFLLEALILFVALIFGGLIIHESLTRDIENKKEAIRLLELRTRIYQQVTMAQEWDDFAADCLHIIRAILPAEALLIAAIDNINHKYQRIAISEIDPGTAPRQALDISMGSCPECMLYRSSEESPARICHHNQDDRYQIICLNLASAGGYNSLMLLALPKDIPFTNRKSEQLRVILPDLANSFQRIQLGHARQKELLIHAAAEERRAYARDLHDSLAQNVTYLRLKLDHIASDGNLPKGDVGKELARLKNVAEETEDYIRNMLVTLYSENAARLTQLFKEHAKAVSTRSDIRISVNIHGLPRALPQENVREIFSVYQEAIRNIEKHSRATHVSVNVTWTEEALIVCIMDNGQGFDPDSIDRSLHFGLTIMEERIKFMQGDFSICSGIGKPTEVKFSLPLRDAETSNGIER